jgi:hypothetical protein
MNRNVYRVTLADGRWLMLFGDTIQQVMDGMRAKGYDGFTVQWKGVFQLEHVPDARTGLDSWGREGMQFTAPDVVF